MVKRRNPVVRHATILRKGGAHSTSQTSRRTRHKQELNDEVDAYFEHKTSTHGKGAASDRPDGTEPPSHVIFLHIARSHF